MKGGLSEIVAQEKLRRHGPNELPASKRLSLWNLLFISLREPMILMLLGCVIIYIFIGEIQDGLLLFISLLAMMAISLYQEHRSTRALEALREISSPRALVIRDGSAKRIPSREVVPGDTLIIQEGDRVPADCRLTESAHIQVDESLLTGEAEPAKKEAGATASGADQLFASTLVTAGQGLAEVYATGEKTEVGKIGRTLNADNDERTRLQSEIASLVKIFTSMGLAFSAVIALAYGLTRHDWPQGILSGIAAAMSLMPEEFPMVMTIFMAMGAWRLSRKNILVRHSPATENLGAVTVLCVDKTGTLTKNEMTLEQCEILQNSSGCIHNFNSTSQAPLPEDFHQLIEYGVLASHRNPFDPMEKAIRRTLDLQLKDTEHVHDDWVLEREYPLSPEILAMSCVWRSRDRQELVVAAKGAPEAIVDLCHLDIVQTKTIAKLVTEMSDRGLRVLAVAKALAKPAHLPPQQHDFDFIFLGLLGLRDPVRPEVPAAIAECHRAGIRVLMITGDHAGTASTIATEVGLPLTMNILTGPEIQRMSDLELSFKIRTTNVFARMVPEQKLRIINALRANHEIVAMTGDGVNDAPSLKWADVGIAMGGRGTDVAREAADLVLLDDCFTSIVEAIRSGRKIFENIKSAMSYIIAVHGPIAGMAIAPILFGLPVALFPAHIVFLEMIIDPSCTLIFEAEPADENTMRRPPRSLQNRLFRFSDVLRSFSQGVFVFLGVFGLYYYCHQSRYSAEHGRTLAFAAFVMGNLGLIVINRLHLLALRNRSFIMVCAIAFGGLVLTIYVPFLRPLFGFAVMGPVDWALAFTVACFSTGLGFLSRWWVSSGEKTIR